MQVLKWHWLWRIDKRKRCNRTAKLRRTGNEEGETSFIIGSAQARYQARYYGPYPLHCLRTGPGTGIIKGSTRSLEHIWFVQHFLQALTGRVSFHVGHSPTRF